MRTDACGIGRLGACHQLTHIPTWCGWMRPLILALRRRWNKREEREQQQQRHKQADTSSLSAFSVWPTPRDAARGAPVFARACSACHSFRGAGGKVGPDLTGSGRHDIGYLIENIADPSAVVAAENLMTVLTLKDGRVLNGMLSDKSERTVTVKMIGQETRIDRSEIAKQEQLPVSMMPEGLLTALTDEQVRHLIAYLQTTAQVPLPN